PRLASRPGCSPPGLSSAANGPLSCLRPPTTSTPAAWRSCMKISATI
ncbi:uncharacterized protein METZ01_LOCUS229290, partial [marine metagenome]